MTQTDQKPTPWTVTIAGSERHDGEAPYTYVVDSTTMDGATKLAIDNHSKGTGDNDIVLISVVAGAPHAVDYEYNDLREKPTKQHMRDVLLRCLDLTYPTIDSSYSIITRDAEDTKYQVGFEVWVRDDDDYLEAEETEDDGDLEEAGFDKPIHLFYVRNDEHGHLLCARRFIGSSDTDDDMFFYAHGHILGSLLR